MCRNQQQELLTNPKQMETLCCSVAVSVQKITSPLGIWMGWSLVIFVAKQSWTCFQYEEPEGGGIPAEEKWVFLPSPPQTALSLSFLLPRLVSPDHPCSLVRSVQQLLVTHVCTVRACWRGMLAILIWEASAHLTFLTKESAVLRLHCSGTHNSAIVLRCAHVCYTQNCPAETRCTGCSVHGSKPHVYTVSVL